MTMQVFFSSAQNRPMRSIVNGIHSSSWSPDHKLTVYRPGSPGVSLPLSELQARVNRVAYWLKTKGVRPQDRIGILSTNRLEWILLDLAALHVGAVTAGFEPEPFQGRADLAETYNLRFLFHDRECAAAGGAGDKAVPIEAAHDASVSPAVPGATSPMRYGPIDICTIKFTSGSTGESKALGATVGSIDQSLNSTQRMFGHGPGDKLLVFLPLSLLQQRYWIYSALMFAHDIVVTTAKLALDVVRRERPTVIMGVPAFFESLKAYIEMEAEADGDPSDVHTAARKILGSKVRYFWTGSAPARPDVLAFFDDACAMPLFEGYGLNETCIVTKNHPGAHRRGSVGKPLDGMHVKINADNVIQVYSDHPVNTRYLYAPEGASERIFAPDGSVITGDLGYFDEDGYLYVVGRADDMVVLENGKNIAVRPLEERLSQVPGVRQVVVIGSGRPGLAAIVSPTDGADLAAIREGVLRDGATKNGEDIAIVIFIPAGFSLENGLLTSQGKVRRKAILDHYADEISRAYGER
ncbi:AMP-binding protein [uncultured Bradyrhizobium sp.]|uniref:AMP-binding protein n=1 Tax=uncultured Bradyrhizobium sp. TaxID=199684 RepID=UPI0035CADE35